MTEVPDARRRPLTLAQAAPLLEDSDYKRIASDVLPDGRWISTVWLGLDHGYQGDGPPNRWDFLGLWCDHVAAGRMMAGDLTCWFSAKEVL